MLRRARVRQCGHPRTLSVGHYWLGVIKGTHVCHACHHLSVSLKKTRACMGELRLITGRFLEFICFH